MKVTYNQQTNEKNDKEAVLAWIDATMELAAPQHLQMLINTTDIIYDSFQTYVNDQWSNISSIELQPLDREAILDESFQSILEFYPQMIEEVRFLGEGSFQGTKDQYFARYIKLIEAVKWILQVIQHLANEKRLDTQKVQEFFDALLPQIDQLKTIMEQQDQFMLVDFTSYELLPVLEQINGLFEPNKG